MHVEFKAGNPSLPEKVLYFFRQLGLIKIRQVRQSLELLQSKWWPHLHALNSSTIAGQSGDVVVLASDGEGGAAFRASRGCYYASLSMAGPVHRVDSRK